MKEKKKCIATGNFDINDLMSCLEENVKEDIVSFEDIVNLKSSLDREIYLGEISDGIGSVIDSVISYWNKIDEGIEKKDRKPIQIIIDSPGGSLTDTFTIIDAIKLSVTPIHTIVVGTAYSGGCLVAMSGHKRYAYPHSSFMLHEGSTSTGGDSHKFINYSKFYQTQLAQLKDIVLFNTKMTNDFYESIKRDDYWLSAYEAKEKGIIDEILGVKTITWDK